MRLDEVQELLQVISELDRMPFPDGAAVSWQKVMEGISGADAEAVVHEWYGSSLARDRQGQVRRILPADVRSGAIRRMEERLRAARRALPPPVARPLADAPPEVQAEVDRARKAAADALAKYAAKHPRRIGAAA